MRKLTPASAISAKILSSKEEKNAIPIALGEDINLFPSIEIELFNDRFFNNGSKEFDTIEGFLFFVEQFENQLKFNGNTKECFTQLRKIFYNGNEFNQILIKGTEDIVIDPRISKEFLKAFKQKKIVVSRDNLLIDMGHVLCGIDGFNNQRKIYFVYIDFLIGAQHNYDLVTWSGDLGSIATELYIKRNTGDLTYSQENKINDEIENLWRDAIKRNASPEDMTGDFDGLIIANKYDCKKEKGGKKPSEILYDYYIGSISPNPIRTRVKDFAVVVGLGENFENKKQWIDSYKSDIVDAILLTIGQKLGKFSLGVAHIGNSEFTSTECASYLLTAFVNALQKANK